MANESIEKGTYNIFFKNSVFTSAIILSFENSLSMSFFLNAWFCKYALALKYDFC